VFVYLFVVVAMVGTGLHQTGPRRECLGMALSFLHDGKLNTPRPINWSEVEHDQTDSPSSAGLRAWNMLVAIHANTLAMTPQLDLDGLPQSPYERPGSLAFTFVEKAGGTATSPNIKQWRHD